MPVALTTAGLPSQPRQGVGARLVRRLGGAVRSVIGTGINLAATLRRPVAAQALTPCRVHRPRPQHAPSTSPALRERACPGLDPGSPAKRAGEGAAPPLPRVLTRLVARRHHHPAAATRPACRNRHDIHFTPQAFPQLSPKACAVLNTPLKDCDPKTLKLLVSAFTQHVNQVLSPEAGMADPSAAFTNLWHRLNAALADANLDTSAPATPEAVPATPPGAVPDAPVASPHPPVQAPPTAPTRLWANEPPRVSPLPPSGPPASDQPADASITAAAPQTQPDIAAPSGSVAHRSRSFRSDTQFLARRRRLHFRGRRPLFPRGARDALQCHPPPRRLCYAACTGPP